MSPLPRPSDFDAVLTRYGNLTKAARHYSVNRKTAAHWRDGVRQSRGKGIPQRPAPADLVAIAKTMTQAEIGKHYKAGAETVRHWFKLTGAKTRPGRYTPPPPKPLRPVPVDFVAAAAINSRVQLGTLYRACDKTIKRWFAETGARTKPSVAQHWTKPEVRLQRPETDNRPHTIYSQAARTLGKFGPVYHCDENGKANPAGKFWRIGRVVADGDELLRRAARYEVAA